MSLRIGTRGSKLALWQAERVKALLANSGLDCELVIIKTTGDRNQTAPLSEIGGKGVFIKEIEAALLRGDVDLAVHSAKDLPSELAEGTALAAFPEREDPRDAIATRDGGGLDSLPADARVGTGSLRRRSQILAHRSDLQMLDIRGNVDTRLRKLDEGQYDAIVLACAGLKRLGLSARASEVLDTETMIPAVGQGTLAIQTRADEVESQMRDALDDAHTRIRALAERAFLARFQGDCQVPVAGHATLGETLTLRARVASLDGTRIVEARDEVTLDGHDDEASARALGTRVGEDVLERGGAEILEEIYAKL